MGTEKMKLKIVNTKGLHARASAKFAETCESFDATVSVAFDGITALGTSIMGLMMLGAAYGNEIEVSATGNESEEALNAVRALVDGYFGEDQ